ncbi:MAG: hypothetical protein ABI759_32520 [Candidatus Solibacter sp.]
MPHNADDDRAVEQFLNDKIDTVPHLEALLLLWASRPKAWSISEMAKGLYVVPEAAAEILDDLARQGLIAQDTGAAEYYYESHSDRDPIVAAVEATYRRELIRISRLIHSKPSAAVREFARAFRIGKDKK